MRQAIMGVLLAGAAGMTSLGCAAMDVTAGGKHPLPRTGMLVSAASLSGRLADPNLVVLHVSKTPDSYAAGHIAGARLVRMEDIAAVRDGIPNELPPLASLTAFARRAGITPASRIVIYDDETGLLAARAYVTLDYMGLGDQAALLDGHLAHWKAAGRPLTKDVPNVAPSELVPRPRWGIIVPLQQMKDIVWARNNLNPPPVAIIDARQGDEYAGLKPGEGVVNPGHIPGAVNVFWMNNVASAADPVMKPIPQLQKLYHDAGLRPGRMVITYCRTGVQASHAYFTAKYLGYHVRIYDGSYIEWNAAGGTEVHTGPLP